MSVNNIDRTEPEAKFLLKMVGLDARPFFKSNVDVDIAIASFLL